MNRGLLCWLAVVLLVGCGAVEAPRYPGELVSPETLGPDFLARQRLVFEQGEHRRALRVVLQKRGDELVMLGLTPLGTRAFALGLQEGEVRMTSYVDRAPPLEPRWVVLDIQRALHPPFTAARAEGMGTARRGPECIRERWRGGQLVERSFERADGRPSGRIRIRYEPAWRERGPARRIVYDNGWLGYRITIETRELLPL